MIRLVLITVWMFVCCVAGFVLLLFRWGDLSLDRYFGQMFSWGGQRICGWKISIENEQGLEQSGPCIFVVNHQSNLDTIPCGWVFPRRCIIIGKKELLMIPLFGLFFAGAGNILLDRKKKSKAFGGLDQAVEIMKKRQASVWVFPEGTRNRTENLLQPFKRGAFYMALSAQVPIVPVVIQPMGELLGIWKGRIRSGTIRMRVLPPISTQGLNMESLEAVQAETHRQMKEAILGLGTLP